MAIPAKTPIKSAGWHRWAVALGLAAQAGLLTCAATIGAVWLLSNTGPGAAVQARSGPSAQLTAVPAVADTAVADPLEAPSPQQGVLRQARGLVEGQGPDGSWQALHDGQSIRTGQRLRTRALSSASLAFYDGSQARLGPETEVSVETLDARRSGPRVIVLHQWLGTTDHDVVPSSDPGSRYQVLTPSGSGTAKGTVFHVRVTPALLMELWVERGAVSVTQLNVTVLVVAGQITTVPAGQPPAEPVFRLTGEGEVMATGAAWNIAGQLFDVDANTLIVGEPRVGDWVSVDARVLLTGQRVADHIVLLRRRSLNTFSFQGVVSSIGPTEWVIAGHAVRVDAVSQIEAGLAQGDLVEVSGGVAPDGVLWAASIRRLDPAGLGFRFTGVATQIGATSWTIAGVTVTVTADTRIASGLALGQVVVVAGRITPDGQWLASSIEPFTPAALQFRFSGRLEGLDPWRAAGVTLSVTTTTEIDDGLQVGDLVSVKGVILPDGTWLALEIEHAAPDEGLTFEFVGQVTSLDPWIVRGVLLAVDAHTRLRGEIQIGAIVKVRGVILANGVWRVDEIKPTGLHLGQFLGCLAASSVVRSRDAAQLVLFDGQTLSLAHGLDLDDEIKVASVVLVQFCVATSGEVTIVQIVFLYQLDVVPVIIVEDHDGRPRCEDGPDHDHGRGNDCNKKHGGDD